jgi:hypothetical protein
VSFIRLVHSVLPEEAGVATLQRFSGGSDGRAQELIEDVHAEYLNDLTNAWKGLQTFASIAERRSVSPGLQLAAWSGGGMRARR